MTFLSLVAMSELLSLTHCGRTTHICVDNLTIIGSDNGLSPGRESQTSLQSLQGPSQYEYVVLP